MTSAISAPAQPRSNTDLFVTFTLLALQGFGGVLAIAQRVLCEQKRWLTNEEFVEMLALAQVLPGPNVCNIALMIGDRFFGWRGALAALGGMMLLPLVLMLALTALYSHYATLSVVAGALKGMGAVSAGMIIGMALKLTPSLKHNPMGVAVCGVLAVLVFAAIALLRWPLIWVLLAAGLLACWYARSKLQAAAALRREGTA